MQRNMKIRNWKKSGTRVVYEVIKKRIAFEYIMTWCLHGLKLRVLVNLSTNEIIKNVSRENSTSNKPIELASATDVTHVIIIYCLWKIYLLPIKRAIFNKTWYDNFLAEYIKWTMLYWVTFRQFQKIMIEKLIIFHKSDLKT